MTTCPVCGIAGNNFSCPNHISYWGIKPLPDSIPTPQQGGIQLTHPISTELFAEIGRLNVLLNERDKEIERLRDEIGLLERAAHLLRPCAHGNTECRRCGVGP